MGETDYSVVGPGGTGGVLVKGIRLKLSLSWGKQITGAIWPRKMSEE